MAIYVAVHPQDPQLRRVEQIVRAIQAGAVVVYPTDSGYALGCRLGDKEAISRIRRIRQLGRDHNFTLLCRDLKEIGEYALIDTPIYRLLRANTPGSYTFILKATKQVPKRLWHPKRSTVGLRIPSNAVILAILHALQTPMLNVSLTMPAVGFEDDEEEVFVEVDDLAEVFDSLDKQVDVLVDAGPSQIAPTSIIDLTQKPIEIIREGAGDVSPFQV